MTFTGGFDLTNAAGFEAGFDERKEAEIIARMFSSEHYENVLHSGSLKLVMPKLIWHLEDLRLGMSYPQYYIAKMASPFVKVALSGTAGDELFGGYTRHRIAMGAYLYQKLPHSLQQIFLPFGLISTPPRLTARSRTRRPSCVPSSPGFASGRAWSGVA